MQILPLCYLHMVAASRSYTCAQDGLDTPQLALVVFCPPPTRGNTSLALMVVITCCNLRWWCYIYIQTDKTAVLLVGVGLAQAHPNNKRVRKHIQYTYVKWLYGDYAIISDKKLSIRKLLKVSVDGGNKGLHKEEPALVSCTGGSSIWSFSCSR